MGGEGLLPYLMFFGGLSLLIWLLLRRSWKGQARAKKQRGKDEYLIKNPRPQTKEWTMSDGPHELNQWQVEMLERTRELQATVDTKLLILQRVLLKVEAAQARLSPEERESLESTLRESTSLVRKGSPNFQSVSEVLCDDTKRFEIYALSDQGYSQEEIAQQMTLDRYAVEMILNLRQT